MTANQKSVVLGLLLFAITVTFALYLIMRGPLPELRPRGRGEVHLEASRPDVVLGANQPRTAEHPRVSWAREYQERMKQRNWSVVIRTSGDEHRTFEMRWKRDQSGDDREHMHKLQSAGPFYEKLRRLGFTKATMHVGRREVWTKNL
jgi:hypothetical protein